MKKKLLRLVISVGIMGILTTTPMYAAEWKQDSIGWWWLEDDGNFPTDCWKEISGKWYYFETSGYMASNKWIGNYYVGADGAMLVNTTTPDGYKVGADGAWIPENATQEPVYQNALTEDEDVAMASISYLFKHMKNPDSLRIREIICEDLSFTLGSGEHRDVRAALIRYSGTNSFGGVVTNDFIGYYYDGIFEPESDPYRYFSYDTLKNAKNLVTLDYDALADKVIALGKEMNLTN